MMLCSFTRPPRRFCGRTTDGVVEGGMGLDASQQRQQWQATVAGDPWVDKQRLRRPSSDLVVHQQLRVVPLLLALLLKVRRDAGQRDLRGDSAASDQGRRFVGLCAWHGSTRRQSGAAAAAAWHGSGQGPPPPSRCSTRRRRQQAAAIRGSSCCSSCCSASRCRARSRRRASGRRTTRCTRCCEVIEAIEEAMFRPFQLLFGSATVAPQGTPRAHRTRQPRKHSSRPQGAASKGSHLICSLMAASHSGWKSTRA